MKIFLVKFGTSRIKELMNVHLEMFASPTVQRFVYNTYTYTDKQNSYNFPLILMFGISSSR